MKHELVIIAIGGGKIFIFCGTTDELNNFS